MVCMLILHCGMIGERVLHVLPFVSQNETCRVSLNLTAYHLTFCLQLFQRSGLPSFWRQRMLLATMERTDGITLV